MVGMGVLLNKFKTSDNTIICLGGDFVLCIDSW